MGGGGVVRGVRGRHGGCGCTCACTGEEEIGDYESGGAGFAHCAVGEEGGTTLVWAFGLPAWVGGREGRAEEQEMIGAKAIREDQGDASEGGKGRFGRIMG